MFRPVRRFVQEERISGILPVHQFHQGSSECFHLIPGSSLFGKVQASWGRDAFRIVTSPAPGFLKDRIQLVGEGNRLPGVAPESERHREKTQQNPTPRTRHRSPPNNIRFVEV
jgi:hypothetical protein